MGAGPSQPYVYKPVWGYKWKYKWRYNDCNRRFWSNSLKEDPYYFMETCCNTYKTKKLPCTKYYELDPHCDFYANHIYKNGRFYSIDRTRRERSECDRVPDLKNICCHSCSS